MSPFSSALQGQEIEEHNGPRGLGGISQTAGQKLYITTTAFGVGYSTFVRRRDYAVDFF